MFVGDNGVTPAAGLELDPRIVAALRERLPVVADRAVAALTAEVPGYAGTLTDSTRTNIELAVQTALGAFLRLAEQSRDADPGMPLHSALEGAYALGRGEARSGRTMDALLAAYRVGARVSWRELSATAVESGLPATTVAQFAELVFAYIDQLSAASVAGHTDELATTGRVRERYLERLGRELLAGVPPDVATAAAERADWAPPETLTAVLMPSVRVRGALALLDVRTLSVAGDLPGLEGDAATSVLLVPDAVGLGRDRLLRVLQGRPAVVGPGRPWTRAAASYRRALRLPLAEGLVDADEHLAALVVGADPEALADLRARVLAPLRDLKPGTAERLAETLRTWLLHQGRREDVAAALVVHPQTVRYRMTQLRELYGDALTDPTRALELTVALALPLEGAGAGPAVDGPAGRPQSPAGA